MLKLTSTHPYIWPKPFQPPTDPPIIQRKKNLRNLSLGARLNLGHAKQNKSHLQTHPLYSVENQQVTTEFLAQNILRSPPTFGSACTRGTQSRWSWIMSTCTTTRAWAWTTTMPLPKTIGTFWRASSVSSPRSESSISTPGNKGMESERTIVSGPRV